MDMLRMSGEDNYEGYGVKKSDNMHFKGAGVFKEVRVTK